MHEQTKKQGTWLMPPVTLVIKSMPMNHRDFIKPGFSSLQNLDIILRGIT